MYCRFTYQYQLHVRDWTIALVKYEMRSLCFYTTHRVTGTGSKMRRDCVTFVYLILLLVVRYSVYFIHTHCGRYDLQDEHFVM
jgi:hypothetical protein